MIRQQRLWLGLLGAFAIVLFVFFAAEFAGEPNLMWLTIPAIMLYSYWLRKSGWV